MGRPRYDRLKDIAANPVVDAGTAHTYVITTAVNATKAQGTAAPQQTGGAVGDEKVPAPTEAHPATMGSRTASADHAPVPEKI